ncbi:hypothetical protein N780_03570 [Pontibacillus chungwhensis BH030062]|uniref:Uncharacterized protein n=1 Tax=Pontibacillus chungwhensis BH030062 TaxID=1385513 RepID=A0A0A2VAU6_9BACI|nr:hypothetical protein N780_03570 [Pontibacillus chungwhensis BH030062]
MPFLHADQPLMSRGPGALQLDDSKSENAPLRPGRHKRRIGMKCPSFMQINRLCPEGLGHCSWMTAKAKMPRLGPAGISGGSE